MNSTSARTYSMNMLYGHVARTCSTDKRHGHAARTYTMDMQHMYSPNPPTFVWPLIKRISGSGILDFRLCRSARHIHTVYIRQIFLSPLILDSSGIHKWSARFCHLWRSMKTPFYHSFWDLVLLLEVTSSLELTKKRENCRIKPRKTADIVIYVTSLVLNICWSCVRSDFMTTFHIYVIPRQELTCKWF